MAKVTNDQQDIIEALIEKRYAYVWERVKFIGCKDVPDISERYIIFHKATLEFNPYQNNNFILFYKRYLRYLRFDQNKTFHVTENRTTIRRLKEQAISPTKDGQFKILEELKKWNN